MDMRLARILAWEMCSVALVMVAMALPALAADHPTPREGSWVVRDFRFHTGEVLPDLRLHYTTMGAPTGEPVLILHGTTQSGTSLLSPAFGGELFGPGRPLDASRYYVILPDLGVRHLRLVLGNSMGGMHTWLWAQKYPDFMDVAVPMASLPTPMSGRNWMTRRLITDSIRNDPEWMNGNYTKQPRSAQRASVFYGIATSGGDQALQKAAPTREKADQWLDQRLSAPFHGDANDVLCQWESSGDYDASAGL
jgi:homoserine O-acetyltransferase/O-succinyltransferase